MKEVRIREVENGYVVALGLVGAIEHIATSVPETLDIARAYLVGELGTRDRPHCAETGAEGDTGQEVTAEPLRVKAWASCGHGSDLEFERFEVPADVVAKGTEVVENYCRENVEVMVGNIIDSGWEVDEDERCERCGEPVDECECDDEG